MCASKASVENTSRSLSLISDDPMVSVSVLQEIIAIAVSAIAVNDLVFMCRVFFLSFIRILDLFFCGRIELVVEAFALCSHLLGIVEDGDVLVSGIGQQLIVDECF